MKRYQLKRRPHAYPITEQQAGFIEALKFCQIKKGMKKTELQDKMKHCIPQYFKDLKAAEIHNAKESKEQENGGEREKEEDYALQPRGL